MLITNSGAKGLTHDGSPVLRERHEATLPEFRQHIGESGRASTTAKDARSISMPTFQNHGRDGMKRNIANFVTIAHPAGTSN